MSGDHAEQNLYEKNIHTYIEDHPHLMLLWYKYNNECIQVIKY